MELRVQHYVIRGMKLRIITYEKLRMKFRYKVIQARPRTSLGVIFARLRNTVDARAFFPDSFEILLR